MEIVRNDDASQRSLGCPSYSFVAVITALDVEIISKTSLFGKKS